MVRIFSLSLVVVVFVSCHHGWVDDHPLEEAHVEGRQDKVFLHLLPFWVVVPYVGRHSQHDGDRLEDNLDLIED